MSAVGAIETKFLKQSDKRLSDDKKMAISGLNHLLSNEFALFTKTLNYHWNVTGPRFHSIHTFLEDHYNSLLEIMDDVAERVRVIGGRPLGSMAEMQSAMDVKESKETGMDTSEMLRDLMSTHREIRKEIKEILSSRDDWSSDPGTEDFFTEVLRKHEDMGWMLRAHVE